MLARLRLAARPLAPAAALVALALSAGLCGPSAAAAQSPPGAGAPRVLLAFLPVRRSPRRPTPWSRRWSTSPCSAGSTSGAALAGSQQRVPGQVRPHPGAARHDAGHARLAVDLQPEAPAAAGAPARCERRRALGGWPDVVERAAGAPAKLRPGLLAQTVPGAPGTPASPGSRAPTRSSPPTARAGSPRSRSGRDATSPSARRRCWHGRRSSSRACPTAPRGRRARPADRAAARRRAADRHPDAAGHLRCRSCSRSRRSASAARRRGA